VEVPKAIWWFVLNGIILNFRPKRSAEAYSTVWTEEGSPLMAITKAQASAIAERCKAQYGDDVIVDFAMRYGNRVHVGKRRTQTRRFTALPSIQRVDNWLHI
jgi:ferrochelatase